MGIILGVIAAIFLIPLAFAIVTFLLHVAILIVGFVVKLILSDNDKEEEYLDHRYNEE